MSQEVLARGQHALRQVVGLHASHIGGPQHPCQHRVLAVGLLHSPPPGVSGHVEHGRQAVPGPHRQQLPADSVRHFVDQLPGPKLQARASAWGNTVAPRAQ